jgi:DeoR/GlpR family transcriptional regulator of sugar metabolism
VADICRALKISEATARRDLAAIEESGHITRTHGGALADYNIAFASLGERAKRARSAKSLIARAAFARVPASGTLFLDAGTTILALARLLARRRAQQLTVVTNSIPVASVLGGAPGITLHLLGGIFRHRQSTLFGDLAVSSLTAWDFDAAFLGGEAMNSEGVFNSHEEVVRLQRAASASPRETFFCLDSSKLGHATPHRVATWPEITRLVTDATPTELKSASIVLKPKQFLAA